MSDESPIFPQPLSLSGVDADKLISASKQSVDAMIRTFRQIGKSDTLRRHQEFRLHREQLLLKYRAALETIAGIRPCVDPLMSDKDIAREALLDPIFLPDPSVPPEPQAQPPS